jgi:hypothetical protein
MYLMYTGCIHICVLLMNKKLSETMVFLYPPVAFSCLISMAGHLAFGSITRTFNGKNSLLMSIIDLEVFVDL